MRPETLQFNSCSVFSSQGCGSEVEEYSAVLVDCALQNGRLILVKNNDASVNLSLSPLLRSEGDSFVDTGTATEQH